MPVYPPIRQQEFGWLEDGGAPVLQDPDPPPTSEWSLTTVKQSLGDFPGGSTAQSEFNNYETFIGRSLKFQMNFMGSAGDTTFTPKTDAFSKLVGGGTGAEFNSRAFGAQPDITVTCVIGLVTLGQTLESAATQTTNQSFWENIGTLIQTHNIDERRADGRPKLMLILGQEVNATFFAYCYGRNSLNAAFYSQGHDRARDWIDARIDALGGDSSNIEYLYCLNGRSGQASNAGPAMTGAQLVRAGLPTRIEGIDVHAYDYSGHYTGANPATKIARRQLVEWEREGKTSAGAFSANGQGFDLGFEIAEEFDLKLCCTEWGTTFTGSAAGVPADVNGTEGGDDNPDFIDFIHSKATAALALGRLGPFCHFSDDVGATGLYHRIQSGSYYDFVTARAQHLSLWSGA